MIIQGKCILGEQKIESFEFPINKENPITKRGSKIALFRHGDYDIMPEIIISEGKRKMILLSEYVKKQILAKYSDNIKVIIFHSGIERTRQSAEIMTNQLNKTFTCKVEEAKFLFKHDGSSFNEKLLKHLSKEDFSILIMDESTIDDCTGSYVNESSGFFEDECFIVS